MSTEKHKITYILGAGASAEALPVVADYTERIRKCAQWVRSSSNFNPVYNRFVEEYEELLMWLANKGDRHKTVDSFARFCYNNEEYGDLFKIKRALVFFFAVEQYILVRRDARYSKFVNTLINSQFIFPKNINIINWNYDFQFQIACDENKKKESFGVNKDGSNKHVPGIMFYYPTLTEQINNTCDPFQMVHMNGIAGFFKSEMHSNRIRHFYINRRIKHINDLLAVIQEEPVSDHIFNFAFEETETGHAIDDRIRIAQGMLEGTDILVVIGYSFAPENNEIDQNIFAGFKSKDKIKRIYVQDLIKDGSDLISKFGFPNKGGLIESVRDLRAFHIPDEYYQEKKKLGAATFHF